MGGRKIHALFIRDITKLKEHEKELQKQQNRVETLLLNILPKSIADQLRQNQSHEHDGKKRTSLIAQQFESVTVLFADIVGFTSLSSSLSPEQLVMLLNSVFSIWDKLTVQFGVEKIKTIGDCYMVVSGAPVPFECKQLRTNLFSHLIYHSARRGHDGFCNSNAGSTGRL